VRADLRNRVKRFEVSELSDYPGPYTWRCRVSPDADGATRIALAGELDMAAAPAFRAELERALTEQARVIVDLRSLDFMDSSGMHALAGADARARAAGTRLVIEHPTSAVLRMLELTGMVEVLEVINGSGSAAR
jgi:anti-anti-sigma factor